MEFELVAPWETLEEVPVEYLYERMRAQRNKLLAESDWTQVNDSPVKNALGWLSYRQQLRDAPSTWTPAAVWIAPEKPEA